MPHIEQPAGRRFGQAIAQEDVTSVKMWGL